LGFKRCKPIRTPYSRAGVETISSWVSGLRLKASR